MDFGYIKTVLSHAAAVHGVTLSTEPLDLARIALKRLGLIGKGKERDRRPTQDELDRIIKALDENPRRNIPVGRISIVLGVAAVQPGWSDHACNLMHPPSHPSRVAKAGWPPRG